MQPHPQLKSCMQIARQKGKFDSVGTKSIIFQICSLVPYRRLSFDHRGSTIILLILTSQLSSFYSKLILYFFHLYFTAFPSSDKVFHHTLTFNSHCARKQKMDPCGSWNLNFQICLPWSIGWSKHHIKEFS